MLGKVTEQRLKLPVSLATGGGYGTKLWAMQRQVCVRFWEGSLRGEGLSSSASLAPAGSQADAMAGLSALGDHGGTWVPSHTAEHRMDAIHPGPHCAKPDFEFVCCSRN